MKDACSQFGTHPSGPAQQQPNEMCCCWALDQSETYISTEDSGLGNEGRLVKGVKPGDALA